ncbi:dienelactone hydrolase family protein [Mollisia scopiformis]|uniref:Dienelactone hydrolase family protein n=1 Tax=Mollisia scopiformis TaxID=149040 RepID=A0A132B5F0_MOLSC|nr:dienelactone hydrolase family protein [Mollisia scopiformis]KUJ07473.1 dienelactone hydrolase family protein [Mollisia scopiformis]
MSVSNCCLTAFQWNGTPKGHEAKLANNNCYITSSANPNPKTAVFLIHDLLGWDFLNVRLLADHYAEETNTTVYAPDFFGGESVDRDHVLAGRFDKIDLHGFIGKNSREIREPEIFACAKALKEKYEKVAAVGFCYGGWAVLRLGAKEHKSPLVDCISLGHPSLMIKKDFDEVAVPVQILAPEIDQAFTQELKEYAFTTIMKLGVPFNYQHFPGVEHACLVRGDENIKGEREAMARGKNAAVAWFKQFLDDE